MSNRPPTAAERRPMVHSHQRKRDVKRLLREIRAEILQLQNKLRAIPRSDYTRKTERELLQENIDEKEYAVRMLQEELRTLFDV